MGTAFIGSRRKTYLRATAVWLLLAGITGVVYPLTVTALLRIIAPSQADGSLLYDKAGRLIGSELIGQHFVSSELFWGRLSSTSPMPYNGAASAGSNLAVGNKTLLDNVRLRVAALRAADPDNTLTPPIDLVTASGSGLDPHISPEAAAYQVARVARAGKLPVENVQALVERYTEGRTFGLLGEPRVNVLRLNAALLRGEAAAQ